MLNKKSICICIPARFDSSRLPGKPLAFIDGKPMIIWVVENMVKSKLADDVVVLTDNIAVLKTVESQGFNAIMTNANHQSGTERIVEYAINNEFDYYINVQGDEPLIKASDIDSFIEKTIQLNKEITTPFTKINDENELFKFSNVKCVFDHQHKALYFSRQAIPAQRDLPFRNWFNKAKYYKHLGIYGYAKSGLLKISDCIPSQLEKLESLEQLKWLENGIPIYGVEMEINNLSIDTPEDLQKINDYFKNNR